MSFGAETTAEEVLKGRDLSGKIVVVTGASSGIGLEATKRLASVGAKVVMANRDSEKSREAFSQLKSEEPDLDIDMMYLDLDSLDKIRAFTDEYQAKYDALHILLNNAGVMACPQSETADGFESQFGVNHLGHFLLTNRLAPLLVKSAPARVINISSAGHRLSSVNLEDPNFLNRPYNKWESYGQSKTANILFALEMNRRLSGHGVLSFSVHPGMIMTDLGRHMTEEDMNDLLARTSKMQEATKDSDRQMKPKSIGAGASTGVWACVAEELESHGGEYLDDCEVSRANEGETDPFGYQPYAKDTELAKKLWDLSESFVGEKFPAL